MTTTEQQTDAVERRARCTCGACSVTVTGQPMVHCICHCTNCRRRSGSAFSMSAYFKKSAVVSSTGETKVYAFHHSTQDNDQQRHFCAACGTTLFWFVTSLPELIGVAAGCFEELGLGEPNTSFTDGKRYSWVTVPGHWRRIVE